MKEEPDGPCMYVLSAKYMGNAEPVVRCLGRKLAKAHGDSFPAFNQIQGGWSNSERSDSSKFHFNYTLVGGYYFQNPPCYLGSLPKPNGVIWAKGKASKSQ